MIRSMHLLILGATGGIGRALVDQASRGGHRVTAFVRSPEKLGTPPKTVTVVQGDPRNETQLRDAMTGCEAVLSALGPPIPLTGRTTIMGDAAAATVRAMEGAGVRRLLAVSGDLQFPGAGPPWLLRVTLLRHLSRDQAEMERVMQATPLDWTIVRPTRLTNGALTGAYRTEEARLPFRARAISRADVAHFLLGAGEGSEHVRQIVGLGR
jgi:putative NADH-flavin reductase